MHLSIKTRKISNIVLLAIALLTYKIASKSYYWPVLWPIVQHILVLTCMLYWFEHIFIEQKYNWDWALALLWPTVQPILVLTCTLITPVSSALPPPDSGNVTDHWDLNLPFLFKTSSRGERPGRKFTSNNKTLPAGYQRKNLPLCSKDFISYSGWSTCIYWVTILFPQINTLQWFLEFLKTKILT